MTAGHSSLEERPAVASWPASIAARSNAVQIPRPYRLVSVTEIRQSDGPHASADAGARRSASEGMDLGRVAGQRGVDMRTVNVERVWQIAGVVLVLIAGLTHLIEAPEYLDESRTVGLLFLANVVGSLVAAWWIGRNLEAGWWLGLAIALGSIVGYGL
jgi:hypothetical protein